MNRIELRFVGFGGQGIVTLGRMAAYCAYKEGKEAEVIAAYGGTARGGSSWTDVIVDDDEIDYPRAVLPDVVVLFSQEAANKYAKNLKEKGVLLYDPATVDGISSIPSAKTFSIEATRIARQEIGQVVVANMLMFGALVGITKFCTIDAAKAAIEALLPERFQKLNGIAFQRGLDMGKSL